MSREGWEGVTQGSSTSQLCFLGPLLHRRRACSQSRGCVPQAGPHLDRYAAGIMKDQREFFRVTQQQLLEEEQRAPSLTVEDWAQDCDPRQISLSTDIKCQALGFNCCRAAGGAEENLLLAGNNPFSVCQAMNVCHPQPPLSLSSHVLNVVPGQSNQLLLQGLQLFFNMEYHDLP